jgi:CRISPR-associated protein Csx10
MSEPLNLRISFASDWGIGTGAGRQGSIDRLIARDGDGLPFVPATTLRGMWRDAAGQLAFGLDDGQPGGGWSKLVPAIFGSEPAVMPDETEKPIPSRLSVGDMRFPCPEARYLSHKTSKPLADALTFVKPGVAIHETKGMAKPEMLRFEEVARQGIALKGKARIDASGLDGKAESTVRSFLLAALQFIERIGSKRRRGAGLCKVEAGDERPDIALLKGDAPTLPERVAAEHACEFKPLPGKSDWTRFRLDITLATDALIADEVQGNLITSLDYIPGTVLIPAVERLLSATLHGRFATGDARVLPAYPAIAGERGLPVPLNWEEKKSAPAELRRRPYPPPDDPTQWKGVKSGYARAVPNGTAFAEIGRAVRTHNAVDDARQKPTQDTGGGVFVYEALKAGQRFLSELWVHGKDVALVETSIPASIGRSKNAGYGSISIKASAAGPVEAGLPVSGDTVSIYLLSDTLLPPGSLQDALRRALDDDAITLDLDRTAVQYRRLDGWIAAWGLPRGSLVAVKAGSVIAIKGLNDAAKLAAKLEVEGLGARRGEGFGHIAVNHPLAEREPCAKIDLESGKDSDTPRDLAPGEPFTTLLTLLEEEAAKAGIREWAEPRAADQDIRESKFGWTVATPNMSQLGGLRSIAGAFETDDRRTAAVSYLQAQQTKHKADDKSWYAKTKSVLENPYQLGEINFTFARDEEGLRRSMTRYAVAALFHGAFRHHQRRLDREAKAAEREKAQHG